MQTPFPYVQASYARTTTTKLSQFFRFIVRRPYYIFAALVSILLLYAAANKLMIYSSFVKQLENAAPIKKFFPVYEHTAALIVSVLVPALEILIPAGFFFKRTRLAAFYGAFFIMAFFSVYAFAVPHLFPGLQTCSCGGIISRLSWEGHFYMNLIFTALAASGLMLYDKLENQPNQTSI